MTMHPHRVIYPPPAANGLQTARRRDEKPAATTSSANGLLRPSVYLVGGRVDDAASPRHRLPSTGGGRGPQRASPAPGGSGGPRSAGVRGGQTATMTTGYKQGLKGRQSPSQHSDVFSFASDTEAVSPSPQR